MLRFLSCMVVISLTVSAICAAPLPNVLLISSEDKWAGPGVLWRPVRAHAAYRLVGCRGCAVRTRVCTDGQLQRIASGFAHGIVFAPEWSNRPGDASRPHVWQYVKYLKPPERGRGANPVLVESRRIWDKAPHNAFTDLLRFKDRWYCVFREGKAHVSPDGALRVITSKDGENWESLALIKSLKYDLRDAKISVAPDGRLMLNGAGMIADAKVRYYSMCWFSSDAGHTWDEGRQIGDPGFWLWRAHWHNGAAYSMGYSTERDRTVRKLRLYKSADGQKYETLVKQLTAPAGCGEDKILFLKDKSALCLLRHETGDKMAQLGTSNPPYKQWKWRDLNLRIGGPNMIQLPDGRILAATRLYSGGTRTSLSWLDPDGAKMTEVLKLPSGGDTSYAGMVWHEGLLWLSYYSSHEGKTSIYLAKVKIPPRMN